MVVLLLSKGSSNLLNAILTDAFVLANVSSIQTNKIKCALYKKIIDLLDEEAFLEKAVVELVYKFDEKSYLECLKR